MVTRALADLLVAAWRELRAERTARREAEADRDSYRLLAQAALAQLAELTRSHARLRERLWALLDERRERLRGAGVRRAA
jgi:hypothetical protein